MKLWQKILAGLAAGVAAGLILGPRAEWLKPFGDMFIGALKMLIGPLVFASLVTGVGTMSDLGKLGRVGIKIVVYFLATTAVAISIGLLIGVVFHPGTGLNIALSSPVHTTESPRFADTLLSLVPTNPVQSFATDNILQVIVFAILFGIAVTLAGERGKPVARVIESLSDVMVKLTGMVMACAPYGVFALMAWVSGTNGPGVLLPLGKVILAVYLGCMMHAIFMYGGLIAVIGKLNPLKFFRGIADAQLVAFATASSAGTLPVNLRCTQNNLGVSESISSFVLPLGATLNMDGTAI